MDIEFHQLELRFADLRVRDEGRERRLLSSLAANGQQVPAVVIVEGDRFVLIDGYRRAHALHRLRRDVIAATTWPVSEIDALIERQHFAASTSSVFEEAWLLAHLRSTGLLLDELARRLCRSKSWVSRRLALVDELAPATQARVREGTIPPHAAMKYLVPLARANRRQCAELITRLGTSRVSTRDVGALYAAWRRADTAGRQRIVSEPHLFLRTLAAAKTEVGDEESVALLKDLTTMAAVAWRARRRVHHLGAFSADHIQAWHTASDAFASLRAALEENHVGPNHPREHPGAA